MAARPAVVKPMTTASIGLDASGGPSPTLSACQLKPMAPSPDSICSSVSSRGVTVTVFVAPSRTIVSVTGSPARLET